MKIRNTDPRFHQTPAGPRVPALRPAARRDHRRRTRRHQPFGELIGRPTRFRLSHVFRTAASQFSTGLMSLTGVSGGCDKL